MSNQISNRQFILILVLTITTTVSLFLPNLLSVKTQGGFWVTLMILTTIALIPALIITKLQRKYPGKTLLYYAQKILGPIGGKIVAFLYILFFFFLLIFITTELINMINANLLPKTPRWFILISTLLVSGYGAHKGLTNIGRLIEIYGLMALGGTIMLHIIMLFQGNFNYIRPLFVSKDIGKYVLSVKDSAIAFIGIEILTLIPLNQKNKKITAITVFTIIGIGILYTFIVSTTIMMVGMNEIGYHKYSMLTAIRQIEIAKIDFLKRFDIIYIIIGLLGINAGFMIVNCGVTDNIDKMFPKMKRTYVTFTVTAIVFIGGLISFLFKDFRSLAITVLSYISIITAGIIPITLLILSGRIKNEKNN